ncbi:hypothetical protein BDK51DRAFT_34445, partial [Blyttiomyces helicus]
CGNLSCSVDIDLRSWEVNFAYFEAGEKKNALVKLRLCPECSFKLNYRKNREREAADKERERERKRKARERERTGDGEETEEAGDKERKKRKDRHARGRRLSGENENGGDDERDDEGESTYNESGLTHPPADIAPQTPQEIERSTASAIWSAPVAEAQAEKSVAEEMDDYFADLLIIWSDSGSSLILSREKSHGRQAPEEL